MPLLTAAIAGLLLFASDHPLHWWPLQLVAFVPLWLALARSRVAGRRLWPLGSVFALAYAGPVLLVTGFAPPIVVAVLASLLQWTLLAAICGRLLDKGPVVSALGIGAAVTLFELAVWTLVPMFGTAQCFARPLSSAPDLVAFVAFTGMGGLVFVLTTLSALVANALRGPSRKAPLAVATALVALVAVADYVRWTRPLGPEHQVAAFGWGARLPEDSRATILQTYERAFEDAGRQGAVLLVTPETGIGVGADRREIAIESLGSFAKSLKMNAALGVWHGATNDNRIWFFGTDGALQGEYRKTHLIPWLEDYVGGDGTVVTTQLRDGTSLGGMICQDDNFVDLARAHGQLGIRLVAVPTNDWAAIRGFHFDNSIFRAIENGYAIVRAASGGISALITPRGEITAFDHVENDAAALLCRPLATGDGAVTVYARLGDWPMLLLAGILGIFAWTRRTQPEWSLP
ncbi:MAG: nitrilase-related carbon-nitrogen hydrolase [Planctomycetota bacterium]